MKIKTVSFEKYKAFEEKQIIQLKPITILIGKNSSGKSSIAKLFTLLDTSLSGIIDEPLLLVNNNVVLGGEFRDLAYNRNPSIPISFQITFDNGVTIGISVVSINDDFKLTIFEWSYQSAQLQLKLKRTPDNNYTDLEGAIYECVFKGFIPTVIKKNGVDITSQFELKIKIDIDYIGPFRILPDRQFHLNGQISYDKTGVKGENAYPMLAVSKHLKTALHSNVGLWYKEHFNGWALDVENSSRPFSEITLQKNGTSVNIVDVGQGMNQALPLIVRAHTKKPDSLIIIEQPELHLHPAAHGDLSELFARSSINNAQNFIIETHSENILLRLRNLIVSNDFNFQNDDVIIYWIDDAEGGGQELTEITLTKNGDLSHWPEGVFNENLDEIIQLRKAVAEKKAAK